MGTHGLYGYVLNGLYYLMYVHFDGDMMLSVMKRETLLLLKDFGSIEFVREEFCNIKWRTTKYNPTKKEIELLKPWTNLEVGERSAKSWYCLLHNCQKSLIYTLCAGYILLHNDAKPSYSKPDSWYHICWWNLDTN